MKSIVPYVPALPLCQGVVWMDYKKITMLTMRTEGNIHDAVWTLWVIFMMLFGHCDFDATVRERHIMAHGEL